jgi:hypothetical protein
MSSVIQPPRIVPLFWVTSFCGGVLTFRGHFVTVVLLVLEGRAPNSQW